jgi:membrane protein YqaA with SNARE-associated domain
LSTIPVLQLLPTLRARSNQHLGIIRAHFSIFMVCFIRPLVFLMESRILYSVLASRQSPANDTKPTATAASIGSKIRKMKSLKWTKTKLFV